MGCLFCFGASAGSQLLDAARLGDAAAAFALVALNPSVLRKAQQWGGQTAWHLAAKEGHADVLRSMADAVRGLDQQQLKLLAKYGSSVEDIIRNLAGEEDNKCLTPLHLACIKGHAEAAEVLMSYGVNPFAMDSVGRTALHYAASWGFADCINAVLSAHNGTPRPEWEVAWPNTEETRLVDVQNLSGFTPLHYAVWVGRKEAIQALASYDASLKVSNTSNDFDWIKVGTGNTPLHLAAFGGDFEVVRLLLAAHVQTLSAGTEVMAAAAGQWGERHADDVRHLRNRRGLMAYHIAMHKHFQHLAELLHPDIPYTFIFSNDDMEVGSVRMFGPPRLMVIAAKALQQKLVDELAAVESGSATVALPVKAAAAATCAGSHARIECSGRPTVDVVVTQPEGDVALPDSSNSTADVIAAAIGGSTAAAKAAASDADHHQHDVDDVSDTGQLPSPVGELLSPFAARSHKKWTASSLSDRSGSTASIDTMGLDALTAAAAPAAVPAAAGPAASFISDTTTDAASVAAGPEAAFSFTSAQVAAAAAAAAASGAVPSTDAPQSEFSFAPIASGQQGPAVVLEQQRQQPIPSSISDTSISASTVPGSASAVAGTPAGSVVSSGLIWPESSTGGSRTGGSTRWFTGAAASTLFPNNSYNQLAAGSEIADAATSAVVLGRGVEDYPAPMSALTAAVSSSTADGSSKPGNRGRAAAAAAAGVRHRRAQSTAALLEPEKRAGVVQRQGSARGHSRRATADWLRPMDSLRRAASRRGALGEDVLPPSIIITTAADDDEAPTSTQQQQQHGNAAGSSTAENGRTPTTDDLARLRHEMGQPQEGQVSNAGPAAAAAAAAAGPPEDNPVDVMLAHRASTIGDNIEAIRQNLLLLKLASGAVNFNTAISLSADALNSPSTGSFTTQYRQVAGGRRSSVGDRPAAATAAGGPRDQVPEHQQQQHVGRSSVESQVSKTSAEGLPPADGTASAQAPGTMRRTSSISRAALARQPSLQRLLSGSSRHRLSITHRQSGDLPTAAAAAAAMLEPAGDIDSAVAAAPASKQQQLMSAGILPAGGTVTVFAASVPSSTNSSSGGLPIIQQQHKVNVSGGCYSNCSGIREEGTESDDDEDTCEICFDATAAVALQPCGHSLCVGCCREMCKLHHFKPALCPYCRQIICGLQPAAGITCQQ